ncbi:hypothetical protein CK203_063116 [Vitis vinifera]|uniref:Uncharacterized protein n=1 Tax=Vitis vinifera TaxID=29760 RepID=A0A438G5N6_VITVI|nr:hypothetical protein CK203_063116 [Vitis vinifera]
MDMKNDGDFEQVRGKILRRDPLPDLEECYALIRREAMRHASMKAESDNPDTSAMVSPLRPSSQKIVSTTPVIGEGSLTLTDPFMKRLPHRHNRVIPKPTYEPELSTKVKYPMSNYVSNHRLSESNKSFVNQLSTVTIPNSVQEALTNPKWKATMNEEMKSLELVECPPGKKPVGCR